MATKAEKEKGRVSNRSGMGGFLNPPGHPEHNSHVETDLRRRKCNRGGMSLGAAVDCEWLDDATRNHARRILDRWEAPPIGSPEIVDWVSQMLGYFRTMYRNPEATGECAWHVSDMIVDPKRDPLANADDHAGVHFIRGYYPDYMPTADDFAGAYWGTKPDA